jgi:glycosyltransferase involved in cell wall biosynthesis
MTRSACVVAVWNELTPYRLHVMRRVREELPEVKVVNVFTHSVFNNSSPWKLQVSEDLNVVFDEANRVPRVEQFAHLGVLRLVHRIEGVIRREHPCFVLMHGHNDLTRAVLIHRLRWQGIPMVHASDGNIFADGPGSGWRRPLKAAYRLYRSHLLNMMDGFMPMGIAGRAFYSANSSRDVPRFSFPYEPDYEELGGVSQAQLHEFRTRHGIESGRRYFICSSRLVPVKRVDVAIKAFCGIAPEHPEWSMMIAGDGPLRHQLEAMVPSNLASRVKFIGFVQMHELRLAYSSAECLVHPSEREPWALVINEAANAGLAIVATDVTGAAIELVRDRVNGRLVRPGCEDALSDALRWIVTRPDLREQRRASRRLLAEWRASADPVAGFREAAAYFAARHERRGR